MRQKEGNAGTAWEKLFSSLYPASRVGGRTGGRQQQKEVWFRRQEVTHNWLKAFYCQNHIFEIFSKVFCLFTNKTCRSSVLRHGVPRVLALISCFSWGATHSHHWLTQFFYLFQSNISQTASHPVSFHSAESCPAVSLNVCDITMATNIPPQSQHGDWRQSESGRGSAHSFPFFGRPAGHRWSLLHSQSKCNSHGIHEVKTEHRHEIKVICLLKTDSARIHHVAELFP